MKTSRQKCACICPAVCMLACVLYRHSTVRTHGRAFPRKAKNGLQVHKISLFFSYPVCWRGGTGVVAMSSLACAHPGSLYATTAGRSSPFCQYPRQHMNKQQAIKKKSAHRMHACVPDELENKMNWRALAAALPCQTSDSMPACHGVAARSSSSPAQGSNGLYNLM